MESKKYEEAKKRVKKKKEFREHLKSFLVVNAIMLGMGWMFGFYYAWQTVIFFWGIGLVFHYVDVYGIPGMGNDEDWEKEEMAKELKNLGGTEADLESMREEQAADEFLDLESRRPVERKNYDEEDLV
ncbi:MAG: 2TM domain-containing protein [Saprospiraceae bacterium]|nr:2TM domain-containing protein [Saprospiraceae bacterium]